MGGSRMRETRGLSSHINQNLRSSRGSQDGATANPAKLEGQKTVATSWEVQNRSKPKRKRMLSPVTPCASTDPRFLVTISSRPPNLLVEGIHVDSVARQLADLPNGSLSDVRGRNRA